MCTFVKYNAKRLYIVLFSTFKSIHEGAWVIGCLGKSGLPLDITMLTRLNILRYSTHAVNHKKTLSNPSFSKDSYAVHNSLSSFINYM